MKNSLVFGGFNQLSDFLKKLELLNSKSINFEKCVGNLIFKSLKINLKIRTKLITGC